MAEKICTHCGYEGKGKKVTASGGGIARVLGIVTMLPFFTLWKVFSNRNGNECPNCHLPALVKLTSDAGVMAQRKFDIELGLITPMQKKPLATDALESFGNEKPAATPPNKKPVDPEQW